MKNRWQCYTPDGGRSAADATCPVKRRKRRAELLRHLFSARTFALKESLKKASRSPDSEMKPIEMSGRKRVAPAQIMTRSEEHTSELQSPDHLVCRLLLEKKKYHNVPLTHTTQP